MTRTLRFPRPRAAALPLIVALAGVAACGNIEDSDDRQWYTKAPLDEPGLTIEAEEPTEMDLLGEPRALVPQQEANFIAPARPRQAQPQSPAQP